MRTANQICADFSDPAIANNNVSMQQGSGTFRRDQRDIVDYPAVINDALCVRREPTTQNDERNQDPPHHFIAEACCSHG
jgi:hypothetical protein